MTNFTLFEESLKRLQSSEISISDLTDLLQLMGDTQSLLGNEALLREYQRWGEKVVALFASIVKISESFATQQVAQTTAEEMVRLFAFESCAISYYDADNKKTALQTVYSTVKWRPPASWGLHQAITSHPLFPAVLKTKRPIQVNMQTANLPLATIEYLQKARTQTLIVCPLVAREEKLIGFIELLDSRQPRHVSGEELALGQLLAKQAAIAVQNTQLYEKSKRKAQEMAALIMAATAVSKSLDLSSVLHIVAVQMATLFNVTTCSISDYDAKNNTITLLAENVHTKNAEDLKWYNPVSLANFPATHEVLVTQRPAQYRLSQAKIEPGERKFMEDAKIRSMLMLPLVIKEKSIGLIELFDDQHLRIFTAEEIALAQIMASHAANAIENARLYQAAQRQRRLAEALSHAAALLNQTLDVNDMIERILAQLRWVLSCRAANIMMIQDEYCHIIQHSGYEDFPGAVQMLENLKVPISTPNLNTIIQTHQPLIIPETQEDQAWVFLPAMEWIRSYAGLPLLIGENVIGFLNLDSDIPLFFTEEIATSLHPFAAHAATAIHNAQLFVSAQQRATNLEILREASLSLTASLDLKFVLQTILEKTLESVPGAFDAHIFLYQDERLSFGASLFEDGRKDEIWSEPRQDGLTYTVARSGEPTVVLDMNNHPLFQNLSTAWKGSIVGLPLKIGARVVGVMNVANSQKANAFSENELGMLRMLGDHAAIAIENAHLHDLVSQEARTDKLTGLHNRRAFDERIAEEIQRAERYQHYFALLMLDLNDFKQVNDTYGHPVGDHALQQVAAALQESVRNTDFLARYGGDEFAIILHETPTREAKELAHRIHHAFDKLELKAPNQDPLQLGISIGIAFYPRHAQNAADLLNIADQAMYQAKGVSHKIVVAPRAHQK